MHECTIHPYVTKLTDLFPESTRHSYVKWHVILLILLLLFFGFDMLAQQRITGKVLNDANVPLSGATVAHESSNTTTVTLTDGSFTINVKAGDVLEISYIGFKTQKIKPGAKTNLIVVLQPIFIGLDEVVATGYTTQRVKEITGSVAIVKPKDLTAVPAGQVEQMLQGRVAGLNIITSGMPGGASNVRLHGIGNFGDVTPLYIIDGVQGNINNLNPDDIESLQVLKDAGAYSIFGVRGANGVIVITTRSGKNGKTKINYDFSIGITRPLKGPDLLNPQETADLAWIALRNSGDTLSNGNPNDQYYGNGPTPVLPDYLLAGPYRGVDATGDRVNPVLYNIDFTSGNNIYQIIQSNKRGTDWFHELFKPAVTQDHTVTVSGGNDKNKYLFSLGYLDQQGTVLYTYLKRFTVRINTTFSVSDKIRAGENLQLSSRDNPRIATQQGYNGNEIFKTLTSPILSVYDINGAWASLQDNNLNDNIVATRTIAKDNKNNYWDILGNAWAEADLLRNLTLKTQFGGTFTFYHSTYYIFGSYQLISGFPDNSLTESTGYSRSYTWTNTLSFSKTFNKHHEIKVLAGTEYISNYNSESGGARNGFFLNDPNYRFLTNGNPATQSNYSFAGISVLSSFISNINYNFKEKFFVTTTLRNDGSSVFSPENRYGWFPSVSAAWRLTQENFLKESTWLTELKLRASWGKSGFYGNTDPANQYTLYGGTVADSYYDIYGISSGAIRQGFRVTRIGEPKTGWQEDIVTNAGFESILWKGKLSATVDVYKKQSKGLLLPITLPDILGGATRPNINVGDVENTGIDVLLGSEGKLNKNLGWSTTLTFTTYKNKIIKLNNLPFFDAPYNEAGIFIARNAIGHPAGSFYGYKIIGFFQNQDDVSKSPTQQDAAPGRFKYLDADNNGVINDQDRVFYGNPNPKFTLGVNIGITYKNFDLSTFCYGSFGNDVLNIMRPDFFGPLAAESKTALYNSWTPQHTNAKAPILENSINFSNTGTINSYSLENGTYFRNKTLMLGYTLPKNILQKMQIENIHIYIQAVNLFTLTRYSGFDPELSGYSDAYGIDFGNYPNNQKQYLIGLKVSF